MEEWGERVRELEKEAYRTRKTLGTIIIWIASSGGAPISQAEATELLKMLKGEKS